MKKMNLLVTDKIDLQGLTPLRRYFKIDKKIGISSTELEKIIGKYHCLITRSATAVPSELINRAKNLKIISRTGIGVDNIDIFAATRHKIAVINAPKGNARSTAEHTVGMIFALLRKIPQAHHDLKRGIWAKSKYVGTQLYGKTLGIVGYGNVGKEVYRIARGIGLNIIVCEPYIRMPKNIRHVTFEELLSQSDIITFHVPMTYLTRHMLNYSTLKMCQQHVFIINCSRGAVIDEAAVKTALINGHIAGLAIDVYVKEPKVDPQLLALDNVVATPHIAGSTTESQKESITEVVGGILQYISGKAPSNLLNPQVFQKKRIIRKKPVQEFDTVIFDCDSTLCTIEGIDELAAFLGKRKEISLLTRQAMEGTANFEDIFHKRLDILKPKRQHLDRLGELYRQNITTDARATIEALRLLGKKVYLLSSSYTPAILHLANSLGLEPKNIFANDLIFNGDGSYRSYIEGPLRRNHGKLQIIRQIAGRKLMIGDGITDLEARHLLDLFIGFGGVAVRPKVEIDSDIFLYNRSMTPVLVLAAGLTGCIKLLSTKYRRYVGKGLDLLSHPKHSKLNSIQKRQLAVMKKLAYYQKL